MVESTDTYALPRLAQKHTCQFQRNTLVDISPRGEMPALIRMGSDDGAIAEVSKGCPILLRDHMKAYKAHMRTVTLLVCQH